MFSPAHRAPLLQFASVAASAGSVIFAKLFLNALSVGQFLLVFAVTSVVVAVPLVDRGSLRHFLGSRIGWGAIVSNAGALTTFYFGLTGLDPGTHSFLSRSYVAFGFVFSYWLFREPFGPGRWVLAALCVVSALLTAVPAELAEVQWAPVAATLVSACLFALNFALLRMAPAGVAPATPVFVYNAVLIPVALLLPDSLARVMTVAELGAGVVSAGLAVLSLYWYVASARGVSFFVSTALRAASPFLVALLALPLFPMKLSAANVLGVVSLPCVLVAIGWLEVRSRRRAAVESAAE